MIPKAKCIFNNPGDFVEEQFTPIPDSKGVYHLEKTGELDLREVINSYKDSCDIKKIIATYNATGDPSLIDNKFSNFGDLACKMPNTLQEIYDSRIVAQRTYDHLDPNVKKQYPTLDSFLENVYKYVPSAEFAKQALAYQQTQAAQAAQKSEVISE